VPRTPGLLEPPYGTCSIGALGPFDHRTGGHLILHEPKVIMEFRCSDVIWIPSAAVMHAWCGGMTVKDLKKKDKAAYQRYLSEGDMRRERGWGLYSTMDSLVASLNTDTCS
jgi:hypothetical protein